ncbi:MAG TPA: GntR family transcriptional regulator [Desulfosarcina sp.]|nr:GntR family transcriptional regulator [Desulfosarcina sp.]
MDKKKSVYDALRFRIINNELTAGEFLSEKQIMAEYKIGRTPLREVFLMLQQDRLIQMVPRLGTVVTTLDIQDVREAIAIRKNLESLVARLAAEHISSGQIDDLKRILAEVARLRDTTPPDTMERLSQCDLKFHIILYDAAKNRRLKEILIEEQSIMGRFWFQLGMGQTEFFRHFDDLDDVIRGLEEKDPEKVNTALQHHVRGYIDRVRQEIL